MASTLPGDQARHNFIPGAATVVPEREYSDRRSSVVVSGARWIQPPRGLRSKTGLVPGFRGRILRIIVLPITEERSLHVRSRLPRGVRNDRRHRQR